MNTTHMHNNKRRSLTKIAATGAAVVAIGLGLGLGQGVTAANAASITGHEVSQTDGSTTITVSGPAENAGSEASVLIMNADGDLAQPTAQDTVWIGQITLDDAGAGSATFKVPGDDLCAYAIAMSSDNGGERYLAPLGGVEACGELGGGGTPGGGDGDGPGDNNGGGSDGDNGSGTDAGDGSDNTDSADNPGSDSGAGTAAGNGDDSGADGQGASGLALTGSTMAPILVAVAVMLLLAGILLFVIRRRRSHSNDPQITDGEA